MRRGRGNGLTRAAAVIAGALTLAGCAGTQEESGRIETAADGAAEILTKASRATVYEASIREIRRRGVVVVSSLEGGWVHGQIGSAIVNVELKDANGGTLVRVLPYVAENNPGLPYSRYNDEAPNIDLARVIANAVMGSP